MKFKKIYNDHVNCFDIELRDKEKILRIIYAGNLDLYLILSNGEVLENENKTISFNITKEDYEIYSIFDSLYKETIEGNVFDNEEEYNFNDYHFNYKESYAYERLVKDNKITWISDNGPIDSEDKFIFYPEDENSYRFDFIRNDKPTDFGFKNALGISVRIRNSGSNYNPFNCIFMRMFQKLQEVDNDYHQIHFEELEYKRLLKK